MILELTWKFAPNHTPSVERRRAAKFGNGFPLIRGVQRGDEAHERNNKKGRDRAKVRQGEAVEPQEVAQCASGTLELWIAASYNLHRSSSARPREVTPGHTHNLGRCSPP
ncbi:hypothetical protein LSTR_LSTR008764 [Laodelphax striatellus]|uniref:Uncharacterized protein n=1 Tax=Laodelphax striatellus TaxID=195883 RepID=A0A482XR54_LAOST|nr:hypothetical protein LSTR_LSTR008764 [Laodelphax striatellus]